MGEVSAAAIADPIDILEALTTLAHGALAAWSDRHFDRITLVKYRENAIFSVHDGDGRRYALRLHRPGYHHDTAIDSELAWMHALSSAGHAIPSPLALPDGGHCTDVTSADLPDRRKADLLTWLDGVPLSAIEGAPDFDADRATLIYIRIGETAARLHDHGTRWTPPPAFQRPRWDRDGLIGEAPLWGTFWTLPALTQDERTLIVRVRDVLRAELSALAERGDGWGLIHADMLADNLVVGPGDRIQPIDFDDCGYGWFAFELATVLNFHLDHPLYPVMRDALLAGYRSVRAFDAVQEATMPMFLMLRALTYLGWVATRSETQTAREQTPFLVERACRYAHDYLAAHAAATPPSFWRA